MRDFNLSHVDFRWVWAKVLPQVYDDTLSYYEQLCKLANTLNELSDECSEHFGELADEINEHYDEIGAALQEVNAELVRLQEEIDELDPTHVQGQIDALDERCDALESTASTHTTQIAGLTSSIANTNTALTSNVATLNSRITNEISTVNTRITNEVSALNSSIGSTNTQLSALTSEVNAQTSAVNSRFNADEQAISALQSATAQLQKESPTGKWLFIYDSYETYVSWYGPLIVNLGLTDGTNSYRRGGSGHGFTVSGGLWITDMINFCSGRTDLAEFKHVVVVGGLNDASDDALANNASVLKTNIANFFVSTKSRMGNAKIHLCFVGSALSNSSYLYGRTASNRFKAINAYKQAAGANGGYFIEGCEYSLFSANEFNADGVHPNSTGNAYIVESLTQGLLQGYADVHYFDVAFDPTQFTGSHTYCYGGYSATVDNGRSRVCLRQVVDQEVQSAFTIDAGNGHDMGELPSGCPIRNTEFIPCLIQKSNSGGYSNIQGKCQVANHHLWVYSDALRQGPSYASLSFAVNDRIDLGDLTFDEFTLFTI